MNAIVCSRGKGGGCRVLRDGPPEGSAGEVAPGEDHPVNKLSSAVPEGPRPPCVVGPPRSERSPILVEIPAGTPPERCTGVKCRARKEGAATIFKVKHPKTGNLTPAAIALEITLPKDGAVVGTGAFGPYLDAEPGRETIMRAGMGYSHFIDCPDAPQFQKRK